MTPDGRLAISGAEDGTVKVWDLEREGESRTLGSHDRAVWAVAIRADGKQAITGADDGTLKVWDLEHEDELRVLTPHDDRVRAVVLSTNGTRAVSASDDMTLKIWDLKRAVCLWTVYGASEYLSAAAADDVVVAGDAVGNVWVLDLPQTEETGSAAPDPTAEYEVQRHRTSKELAARDKRTLNRIVSSILGARSLVPANRKHDVEGLIRVLLRDTREKLSDAPGALVYYRLIRVLGFVIRVDEEPDPRDARLVFTNKQFKGPYIRLLWGMICADETEYLTLRSRAKEALKKRRTKAPSKPENPDPTLRRKNSENDLLWNTVSKKYREAYLTMKSRSRFVRDPGKSVVPSDKI
jgi:hypothetical protein